jgi:putative transposase
MALHLAEISQTVTPGAHAVLLLDQAGWHLSDKLDVPDNITLMPLPPKSPELNPVENIWQYMRDNWLSNRVFQSYDDILDHCCHAWNRLIDKGLISMPFVVDLLIKVVPTIGAISQACSNGSLSLGRRRERGRCGTSRLSSSRRWPAAGSSRAARACCSTPSRRKSKASR